VPKSLEKSLIDITNAYLAVEDLLKSDVLTPQTREKLGKMLELLDSESARLMREHADNDKAHGQVAG
jgi:hypothetical protein